LGVPLFVILSGVLLLDPAKADESLTTFFKKRFARIGIPLVFWTIAYFAWANQIHGTQLTVNNIFAGLLSGSYPHLWFLYLLIGLYSITPVLRVVVKYLNRQKFTYFLTVWFIGTVLVPFMRIFLPSVGYNPVMFVFTGWTGFFVLGVYLLKNKTQPWTIWLCLITGLAVAVIGDGIVPLYMGAQATGFFHDYLSFNVIIASAALFLLLASVPASKIQTGNSIVNRLVCWMGKNTLGIYLVHVMVLETIEYGYLGVQLNMNLVSPIVEVPLLVAVTLAVTSLIVYALNKVPYVNRILGSL
jgi:surface polysaccharide O-acyltransferase-like enzyme